MHGWVGTYRWRGHTLVRIIVSSGGDILINTMSIVPTKRNTNEWMVLCGRRTGASFIFDLNIMQPRSADANEGRRDAMDDWVSFDHHNEEGENREKGKTEMQSDLVAAESRPVPEKISKYDRSVYLPFSAWSPWSAYSGCADR